MADLPPPSTAPLRILLTGGAGFIGSHLAEALLAAPGLVSRLVIIDRLSTGGRLANLQGCLEDPRVLWIQADLVDTPLLLRLLTESSIDTVIHAAAESHVDRSIAAPGDFVLSNVVGTQRLLEACRQHLAGFSEAARFRCIHLSTDEVYGPAPGTKRHSLEDRMRPSSPYAASKAAAELLARAWAQTYGLPLIVTHCTNNYGPRQWPEKLIPRALACALQGKPIPLYGDGSHERTWLHVTDHVAGLVSVVQRGKPGETYAFSGETRLSNSALLEILCRLLDQQRGQSQGTAHDLIQRVPDRPGHDAAYAIEDNATRQQLRWAPRIDFTTGLSTTIAWYLQTPSAQGGLAG